VSALRVAVGLVPRATPEALARPAGASWEGVAVDVLRATTTLSFARANGAGRILPFAETSAAIAHRGADPNALACGERDGRIVPGFDLGNSPAEFTRERVSGRAIAFASTNGSLAMRAIAGCGRRWLGAFVSAEALARALEGASRVWIVCAGKLGAFALEDAACAGWLVARLVARGARADNDAARLCAALAPRDADEVRALVEGCDHARYLAALGEPFARDVAQCATLDVLDAAQTF